MLFGDSLTNFVAGIGGLKDKAHAARFGHRLLDRVELDAMYRNDWIAGTIIDAPCDDMTREWREWKAGPRQTGAIEAEERRLNLRQKVNQALKLARKDGGSALLLGVGDDKNEEPLDLGSIRRRGLLYVHVLSRFEISTGPLDRDPLSLYFGEPAYYTLASAVSGTVNIHPSRVVRFAGVPRLDLYDAIDGWGYSVLERIYDAVRDAAMVNANFAALTNEAKVDVFKIKGLTQNVVIPEYREKVIARFALANTTKSINNALITDADEEWDQKKVAFSHFPEMVRQYIEIAAGAGQMPVTRLLGTSPGGLSNNNDGSLRHYYDTLSSRQEVELRPALTRLDDVLIRSALGTNPDGIWYEFKPLWQLTESELADVALRKAQATQIYAQLGVMPKETLREATRSQISEDGIYPGFDAIVEKHQSELPEPLIAPRARASDPAQMLPKDQGDPAGGRSPAVVADAEPRTLYVSRKVENAAEILRWAKSQGFGKTLSADDLHVTVAYSKLPVDWFAVGTDVDRIVVPRGGPRMVERFDGGATVLLFSEWSLSWRHENMCDAGCSWDHLSYQPHITISYDAADLSLVDIEPYQGKIVLGPEIFAEVDDDWRAKATG
ncbi:hypothetical protein SB2_11745 [Methylobacterium radiotolerans]|nr:hypothetical protein SB3_10940 [Methylobacterium radiotolerans]KTS47966.1 hypothetical protein SB2_11745 [Methylobacterium radiotolerans]